MANCIISFSVTVNELVQLEQTKPMDKGLRGASSVSAIEMTACSSGDCVVNKTVKPLLWIVHKMAFRHVPYLLDSIQLSSSILAF